MNLTAPAPPDGLSAPAWPPGRLLPAFAAAPVLLLTAALIVVALLEGRAGFQGFVAQFDLFAVIAAVSFSAVAVVVARHQPGNAVARVAAGIAWGFTLSYALEAYGNLGLPRGWPLPEWAIWISTWVWVPALWAIPTWLVLRFPNGRLHGPRWRIVELWTGLALVVLVVGWALTPYGQINVEPSADVTNPLAVVGGRRVYDVGFALALAALVASLSSFAWRFARSNGVERAQLKWALLGTCAMVLVIGSSVALGPESALPASLGVGLLPASVGVAIVRHRLWDVDLVIRRSLVYSLTTVMILVVYVGTVAALGGVLGGTAGAPLIAAGLVALAVQPLRERAQRLTNRLLYGEREDPYTTLSRLGEHLAAAGERDRLLEGVTEAVVQALRLAGASIRVDGRDLVGVGELTGPGRDIPLAFRGEPVGSLRVALREGDHLHPSEERLLEDLARHVAVALHADRLHDELLASRARLLTAREEERRRIRRDLHDELGPTLAAIALRVEQASLEADDAEVLRARLDEVTRRVRDTVRVIRTLVEGLRPAALDELGLLRAVEELARQLTTPELRVRVEPEGNLDHLPAAVEVAAYRIVAEALTKGPSRTRLLLPRPAGGP
ncbi:MAG: hypothetical protein KY462_03875 [Actinobacteria bacterium]|nr:hypothetical protein [Actinomycetota bacterium]